ncbi:MAG: class I SAM-dependent methyltransferase [Magnetococcales bacterium]|nr:class I SAM-dependent methyltransferase [Magnetococcales bacterium]
MTNTSQAYQLNYFHNFQRQSILARDTPYIRRHLEQVMTATGFQPGQRLLELGAGMGRFSRLLAIQGAEVVANDLSAELLANIPLDETEGRIRTLACHVAELPQHIDAPFERAVGFFMLHHMSNLVETFQALGHCLLPGARVAFCEPNAYSPLFPLQIALTPGMTWKGESGIFDMRPPVLLKAMAQAGFQDIRIRRYGFFPPFLANRHWGRALETHLENLSWLEPLRSFQIIAARWPD